MAPNDVAIWERYIEKNPEAFDFVQYDVPCGSTPEFDTTVNDNNGATANALYKKRIDVVGFKGEAISIVEVKPRAGASSVGQVKMYLRLYKKDYSPPTEPQAVIITDNEVADVREYAHEEGVSLEVA